MRTPAVTAPVGLPPAPEITQISAAVTRMGPLHHWTVKASLFEGLEGLIPETTEIPQGLTLAEEPDLVGILTAVTVRPCGPLFAPALDCINGHLSQVARGIASWDDNTGHLERRLYERFGHRAEPPVLIVDHLSVADAARGQGMARTLVRELLFARDFDGLVVVRPPHGVDGPDPATRKALASYAFEPTGVGEVGTYVSTSQALRDILLPPQIHPF